MDRRGGKGEKRDSWEALKQAILNICMVSLEDSHCSKRNNCDQNIWHVQGAGRTNWDVESSFRVMTTTWAPSFVPFVPTSFNLWQSVHRQIWRTIYGRGGR